MTDENTTPEELTQEQKDAASAEAYRAQLGTPAADDTATVAGDDKPQRPEHIPEKFWDAEKGEVNVEALAKSYVELEKAKATPEMTEEEKAAAEAAKSDTEKAQAEFVEHREKMTAKLVAGEALTDEDYKPLEARGLSRRDVDDFVEGMKARAVVETMKVHAEVGGEKNYTDMIAWAKANLSTDEIRAYNHDVVESNDPAVNLNAVRGLAARYREATGRTGAKRISGSGKVTEGYSSKAEMIADMRDPKYAKDPAFRAEVSRKVAGARAAGVDLSA